VLRYTAFMTHKDKEFIIKSIMQVLWKFKDYPPRLIAERILIDCLEKELNDLKGQYERLFFVDMSKEN
jgi:hypothetical protein